MTLLRTHLHQPRLETDRILGCVFGSITGDVLGAYCEFETRRLQPEKLEESTDMPMER